MKLARNQRCPLPGHGYRCPCPRQGEKKKVLGSKWVMVRPGVYRIDDPHHPRGFRERRSKSELKKLTLKKVEEQGGLCCVCNEPFLDMEEVTTEHLDSRGMGGSKHDEHPDNIGASHGKCNAEKGSRPLSAAIAVRNGSNSINEIRESND